MGRQLSEQVKKRFVKIQQGLKGLAFQRRRPGLLAKRPSGHRVQLIGERRVERRVCPSQECDEFVPLLIEEARFFCVAPVRKLMVFRSKCGEEQRLGFVECVLTQECERSCQTEMQFQRDQHAGCRRVVQGSEAAWVRVLQPFDRLHGSVKRSCATFAVETANRESQDGLVFVAMERGMTSHAWGAKQPRQSGVEVCNFG